MIGAPGDRGLRSRPRVATGRRARITHVSQPRPERAQRRTGARASAASVREDLPRQVPDQIGATSAAAVTDGVPAPPPSLGTAVAFAQVRSLPCQDSMAAAVQLLMHEAAALRACALGKAASGVVRLEVPIPATFTSLQWLMTQPANTRPAAGEQPGGGTGPHVRPQAPAVASAYFSARSAPAPASNPVDATTSSTCAGLGSAWTWRGEAGEKLSHAVMAVMQRFLIANDSRVKVLGGARFDPHGAVAPEWAPFGSYYMMLPAIELVEGGAANTIAVNVVWDAHCTVGTGADTLALAVENLLVLLSHVRAPTPAQQMERPHILGTEQTCHPDRAGWETQMQTCLRKLNSEPELSCEGDLDGTAGVSAAAIQEFFSSPGGAMDLDSLMQSAASSIPEECAIGQSDDLTKVVLARRARFAVHGRVHALHLLDLLQQSNASSYQVALVLPCGAAFVASPPERLYLRDGRAVSSEAVAGTRRRGRQGDVQHDFYLGLELLTGRKEHVEFSIVRDWVRDALGSVCAGVTVLTPKALLKQRTVQHLYAKITATLHRGKNDADLLEALHPTPAVCGRPQDRAYAYLQKHEDFDRGFYAGPFGYLSGTAAEFVVGIRSALVLPENSHFAPLGAPTRPRPASSPSDAAPGPTGSAAEAQGLMELPRNSPPCASLPSFAARTPSGAVGQAQVPGAVGRDVLVYTGVGVVHESDAESEWQELDLKALQWERLLRPTPPLTAAANDNALWAHLIVDELVRCGVDMFAIAPGSRSSPLTHAVFAHPRAAHTLCIDERSLAFWALGRAAATGRPGAIITTSGTAVANLLPAVVEASSSAVPLILLTADRPVELRDTGANQTIDQVKIFGSFVRWAADLAPPEAHTRGALALTTIDAAVRHALSTPPGPVQLNVQLRDPLAPTREQLSPTLLKGLDRWFTSTRPYTAVSAQLPPVAPGQFGDPLSSPDVLADARADALSRPVNQAPAGYFRAPPPQEADADLCDVMGEVHSARRGVLLVGELRTTAERAAVLRMARTLGWPIVADALSGLRIGAAAPATPHADGCATVIHHLDTVLTDPSLWPVLRPDCVLQIGTHVVSKRVLQFITAACDPAVGDLPPASAPSTPAPANRAAPGPAGNSAAAQPPVLPCTGPAPWIYCAADPARHDASHLVSEFVQCTPPRLAEAFARCTPPSLPALLRPYRQLLDVVDRTVGARLRETVLAPCPSGTSSSSSSAGGAISEPCVAMTLADHLPREHGLFIGSSMPIRDLDMYSQPRAARPRCASDACAGDAGAGGPCAPCAGLPPGATSSPLGIPVAANRGASGIDGVLSSAAGFASGLRRPTTLLVGDVSFLHDTNGLLFLHDQELSSPLTVVLVNNAGGGIFHFLPVADAVEECEFTQGWATPPNVDLDGLCRAHHVPYQRVTAASKLLPALETAWALNAPSVVEVVTDRHTNVEVHRAIQRACVQAAHQAVACLRSAPLTPPVPPRAGSAPSSSAPSTAASLGSTALPADALPAEQATPNSGARAGSSEGTSAAASSAASDSRPGEASGERTNGNRGPAASTSAPSIGHPSTHSPSGAFSSTRTSERSQSHSARVAIARRDARIVSLTWAPFSAPLAAPATSATAPTTRQGLVVTLTLQLPDGRHARACGEVAPLPGLHAESLGTATSQLATLAHLLPGVPVPADVALLDGRLQAWWACAAGVSVPALAPTVLFGVESAMLGALARAQGRSLAGLLQACALPGDSPAGASPPGGGERRLDAAVEPERPCVLVNGLLDSGLGSVDEAVSQALRLLESGHSAIKVKVGRRRNPRDDAAVVNAISAACDAGIALRADANRLWTLDQALAFAEALESAGTQLEYIEEPVSDPCQDLGSFVEQTSIPVALDESLDDGLVAPHILRPPSPPGTASESAAAGHSKINTHSVAALVIKPALLGSLETTAKLLRWARARELRCVISTAFETSLGVSCLAALAACADTMHVHRSVPSVLLDRPSPSLTAQRSVLPSSSANRAPGRGLSLRAGRPVTHGLSTLSWLQSDLLLEPLQLTTTASGCHAPSGSDLPPPAAAVACLSLADVDRVHDATSALSAPCLAAAVDAGSGARRRRGGSAAGVDARPALEELYESSGSSATGGLWTGGVVGRPAARGDAAPERMLLSTPRGAHVDVRLLRVAPAAAAPPGKRLLFLHGFMGAAGDWVAVMAGAAALGHECVALDLPGHGATTVHEGTCAGAGRPSGARRGTGGSGDACGGVYTLAGMTDVIAHAIDALGWRGCTVVGYSLGARIALQMAHDCPDAAAAVVSVSGSPGLQSEAHRSARLADDALRAGALRAMELPEFVASWYAAPLWDSLRGHPRFAALAAARGAHGCPEDYAAVLQGCSPGTQNLWPSLMRGDLQVRVAFVVGALDAKFVGLANAIAGLAATDEARGVNTPRQETGLKFCSGAGRYQVVQVLDAGHAVHTEQPVALTTALHRLLES